MNKVGHVSFRVCECADEREGVNECSVLHEYYLCASFFVVVMLQMEKEREPESCLLALKIHKSHFALHCFSYPFSAPKQRVTSMMLALITSPLLFPIISENFHKFTKLNGTSCKCWRHNLSQIFSPTMLLHCQLRYLQNK